MHEEEEEEEILKLMITIKKKIQSTVKNIKEDKD